MEPMGTVVIDEHIAPIFDIRLENGQIVVQAEVWPKKKMSLGGQAEYRVIGRDGTLIWVGRSQMADIDASPGDNIVLTVTCDVHNKLSDTWTPT